MDCNIIAPRNIFTLHDLQYTEDMNANNNLSAYCSTC